MSKIKKSRIYDIYNTLDNDKKVFEGDIRGAMQFLNCSKSNIYCAIYDARNIKGYKVVPRKGKYETLYLTDLEGNVILKGSKEKLSRLLDIPLFNVYKFVRERKIFKDNYLIKTEEDYIASL